LRRPERDRYVPTILAKESGAEISCYTVKAAELKNPRKGALRHLWGGRGGKRVNGEIHSKFGLKRGTGSGKAVGRGDRDLSWGRGAQTHLEVRGGG